MARLNAGENGYEPVAARAGSRRSGAHTQLSEMVATQLREQIVSGKLKQGQFLRIDAIAKALGVSMTPVREGLLLLQSESFVRLIPRRGFVVNSFSKQDLLDLFWAQATFGAELAARAARLISDEDIARLEEIDADYRAAVAAGDESIRDRLGHHFHRAVNIAAQSPRLALLLGSLAKQLPDRFYGEIEGRLGNAVEYHPLILKAIRTRNAKQACTLMYDHLIAGGEQLVAMLERQGLWGAVLPPKKTRSARAPRPTVAKPGA